MFVKQSHKSKTNNLSSEKIKVRILNKRRYRENKLKEEKKILIEYGYTIIRKSQLLYSIIIILRYLILYSRYILSFISFLSISSRFSGTFDGIFAGSNLSCCSML